MDCFVGTHLKVSGLFYCDSFEGKWPIRLALFCWDSLEGKWTIRLDCSVGTHLRVSELLGWTVLLGLT